MTEIDAVNAKILKELLKDEVDDALAASIVFVSPFLYKMLCVNAYKYICKRHIFSNVYSIKATGKRSSAEKKTRKEK